MHLTCLLGELADELDLDDRKLGQILGLDERTVEKIRTDSENWRISRRQLENLWRFAADHGFTNGPFELKEHPIWDSFRDQPSVIFRSSYEIDAVVERHLQKFLRHLDSTCEVRVDETSTRLIQEVMRQKNTIFVGSPKANSASEIALALLFKVEPFSSAVKRNGVPLRFLGMEPTYDERSSTFLVAGPPYGIELFIQGRRKPLRITVNWLPAEEYWPYRGEGVDAGVAVVCPQPLGTELPVRSVIIAGYTGLATETLAHELTHGEPAIYEADLLKEGVPQVAMLGFRFHKRRARSQKGHTELRRIIEGTKQWGPPWPKLERGL